MFTIGNITTYFVSRIASDGKKANDYKNLNSRAYALYKAGHIQSIMVLHMNNLYYVKCACLPEMKKDIVYRIELVLDRSGDIMGAGCGCPAGGKPYGSCKHISALCYALEEYSRIKEIRQPDACTSRLQEWNQPRKRRLDSREVEEIAFVKEEYGKNKRHSGTMVFDPRPIELQCTSPGEVSALRNSLADVGKDIAFLHLLSLPAPIPSRSGNQKHTIQGHVVYMYMYPLCLGDIPLPLTPIAHCERESALLASQPQPPCLQQISKACEKFLRSLSYSPEQARAVERATIKQRDCKRWHEERKFRITASNFGLISKRQRNHLSLTKQLLYKGSTGLSVPSLMWGQQHEADALEVYKQSLGEEFSMERGGIFISLDHGFLGASPDALVKDRDGITVKLVEVKCPYKARQTTVCDMCRDGSFYCSLDSNSQPKLKDSHEYYFQVQGQMAVSNIHVCDFVVWTPMECTIECIQFDKQFWSEKCYPFLQKFYINFLLPEIIYPKYPALPFDYSPHNLSIHSSFC